MVKLDIQSYTDLYAGEKLLPSYNFLVTIGKEVFSFSKVSNLVSQIEYETVLEGGNNDHPLLFPKQKSTPDILILEKGVRERSTDQVFNSLMEGMHVELVTILLIKDDIHLLKAFFLKEGIITKRTFSDLDAMRYDLLIETMEIAHSGLVEVKLSESQSTLPGLTP
ncbi:MAG: phage tail protein [Lachnospiraceae bacterium]|nr:phage tail protein [Lachnospiraceae bacterium]